MSHLICLASDTPPETIRAEQPDICIRIDKATGAVTTTPENFWEIWPIPCAEHLHTALPYLAEVAWHRCTPDLAAALADYIRRQLETAETVELWNFWDGSDVELVRVHREEISLVELTPEKISALCEKDVVHPSFLAGTEVWHQHCLCIIHSH